MDDNHFPPALPWRGRLAVLSRQLTQGGEGAGARAGGGESGTVAAAPTFSTSSAPATPPPPPPLLSVVVLGGCVMDVVATPSRGFALSPGGSVPGSVSLTPGGVGRNVAVALAGLLLPPPRSDQPPPPPSSGLPPRPPPPPPPLFSAGLRGPSVRIVSVVGSDPAGDALISSLERAGVDASGVGRLPSSRGGGGGREEEAAATAAATPVVVAVHDGGTGDVACSVADVAAVESDFTPDIVRRELSRAERESGTGSVALVVVVVDGNLSAAAVAAAAASEASRSSSPGIALFEPVSVAKGVRAVREGRLKCRVMTPNAAELLAMARAVEEGTPPPERSVSSSTSSTSSSTSGSLLYDDGGERGLDSFLKSTLSPAARALISRGVCEFVLVTLGEKGAALIGREGEMALRERTDAARLFAAPAAALTPTARRNDDDNDNSIKLAACVIPAAPVPGSRGVVSTGGAGDAFAAGFLAAACRGRSGGGRGKGSEEATTTPATKTKTTATIAFALAAGAAAAAQVVSSPLSSPTLDAERVWECAGELERQARFVTL